MKVWDVASGERLYTLSEPLDGLNTIALDPSGTTVAAGGLDKTIRIWSLGDKGGKLLNSLIAHEDAILQLAWSPDGKYLISSSADKTIKIFKADDLSEIKTVAASPTGCCRSSSRRTARVSPSGDSTARIRFTRGFEVL